MSENTDLPKQNANSQDASGEIKQLLIDKFSTHIFPNERKVLLAGPTRLVIPPILDAASTIPVEIRQKIMKRIVYLSTVTEMPQAISNFNKLLMGEQVDPKQALDPFATNNPSETNNIMLSIFCGFINAANENPDFKENLNNFTAKLDSTGRQITAPEAPQARSSLAEFSKILHNRAGIPLPANTDTQPTIPAATVAKRWNPIT